MLARNPTAAASARFARAAMLQGVGNVMSKSTAQHERTDAASFLGAGFMGWACLLAASGTVLLAFCAVYSLVFMSLETFTLSMGTAAFAFAGMCWLFGRLARS